MSGVLCLQSGTAKIVRQPQWSPPLDDGSTGHLREPGEERAVAAMEPAVGRREHVLPNGLLVVVDKPQWSPPPTSGKTGHRPVVPIVQEPPQRSRRLSAGARERSCHRGRSRPRRNGARPRSAEALAAAITP